MCSWTWGEGLEWLSETTVQKSRKSQHWTGALESPWAGRTDLQCLEETALLVLDAAYEQKAEGLLCHHVALLHHLLGSNKVAPP